MHDCTMEYTSSHVLLIGFGFFLAAAIAMVGLIYRLPSLLDPQGESNSSCMVEALAPVSNGQGMIISGHRTLCDDFIHDSAVYVYLHEVGMSDDRQSLIFRYIDKPLEQLPELAWNGRNSVSIKVKSIV